MRDPTHPQNAIPCDKYGGHSPVCTEDEKQKALENKLVLQIVLDQLVLIIVFDRKL